MTKVLFSYPTFGKSGPLFFDCYGHSDYVNEMGYNDCCVAVSNLTILLINFAKDRHEVEPVICKDGHVRIEIADADRLTEEVFRAVEGQFKWLAEQYPKYLKIY